MEYQKLILEQYSHLGRLQAEYSWVTCRHEENHFYSLQRGINVIQKKINMFKANLSMWMDDSELNEFMKYCLAFCRGVEVRHEIEIERNFRPSDLTWNKDAVIVCTTQVIPEDILIGLSFGYKFLFPYFCNSHNLHELLAQLEVTMDNALPFLKQLEASIEIKNILKNNPSCFDDTKAWLKFISKRSAAFFKEHPKIIAIKSDKGGHTVIMDVSSYEQKLEQHLSDRIYVDIQIDPLKFLIGREQEIVESLMNLNAVSKYASDIPPFQPNLLQLAKFYGLPKIHKSGMPLRPITSTVNAPGYFLAKLFYKLLDIIFPRTPFHVRDSYEFVDFINGIKLEPNDVLVSFDVVSMYTSIPFELVYDIIMRRSGLFWQEFGIDRYLLSDILIFLLEESSVFTVLDRVYKQIDGLPMGSCLSPLAARLVMDEVVLSLLNEVPITFIKVFVDDTIAAVNGRLVDRALNVLNQFAPGRLVFTCERENNYGFINFLNISLARFNNNTIFTLWYRKVYASGRLLNCYSSHKWSTIIATAVHFIRTVLLLSNGLFFHFNKQRVIDTLRLNSFPEITILTLMNTYYTFMRPFTNHPDDKPSSDDYVIFPYAIGHSKQVRSVILDHKYSSVFLADSVKNTKINFVKTVKTQDPLYTRGNLILTSQCQCKKKCIVQDTQFNESGALARNRLRTIRRRCVKSGHAYREFDLHKGLYYKKQSGYLLRYLQWMHRHKLDLISYRYHFPISKLSDLIKCKCCNN